MLLGSPGPNRAHSGLTVSIQGDQADGDVAECNSVEHLGIRPELVFEVRFKAHIPLDYLREIAQLNIL